MKVLALMISMIAFSSSIYASDCDTMEPIDPGFGECLEQELLAEAMDGITKNDFEEEAREIASIDKEMEKIDNLSEDQLETWDGDSNN